jgi:hypothetical protein
MQPIEIEKKPVTVHHVAVDWTQRVSFDERHYNPLVKAARAGRKESYG